MPLCSREALTKLYWREDDGSAQTFTRCEVGNIHILVHCQHHLIAKEILSEDIKRFRFNSIDRKEWDDFVKHPCSIRLISSAGDITVRPPSNLVLSDNFKSTYSPVKSFKSLLNETQIFLLLQKMENIGMRGEGARSTLPEYKTQRKS